MQEYKNLFSNGAVTILNPFGDHAVGCFWRKRDSKQVLNEVNNNTALVGNSYYDPTSCDMELCAHYIARSLWANPQITSLSLVGSDTERAALGAALSYHIPLGVSSLTSLLTILPHTSLDYPLPTITPPSRFLDRNASKLLYGGDLELLHKDALGTILRYGKESEREDPRVELTNMLCEWQMPFNLGLYAAKEEEFIKYSTDSLGVEIGSDYTYNSRFKDNYTERDILSRKNWTPIWCPEDSTHEDPPCMVGIYTRDSNVTAVFRAHNILNAWPKNMYLVKYIGKSVLGDRLKSVTILSLQAGLRLDNLEKARDFIGKGKVQVNSKGGSWNITKEGDTLVAALMNTGKIVQEFKGSTAEEVCELITQERAWPQDYSECAWIGKELGKL